jgi:hypothetical protein
MQRADLRKGEGSGGAEEKRDDVWSREKEEGWLGT